MKTYKIVLAFLAVVLFATPALATIVQKLDLPSIVTGSDVIVKARVMNAEAIKQEKTGHIYTRYTLEVLEKIKGKENQSKIIVEVLGGIKDGLQLKVPGVVYLTPDEVGLFFLKKAGELFYMKGLAQGFYKLEKNASGDDIVVNDSKGATYYDMAAPKNKRMIHQKPVKMTYIELAEKVRTIIRLSNQEVKP